MIARIFADDRDSTSTSNVLNAVEWCGENGANIVNLSLGAEGATASERSLYQELYTKKNILVLAAAGNSGSSSLAYPASLDTVVSVASVDVQNRHSYFSQTNAQVELSAPGEDILTTAGGGQSRKVVGIMINDQNVFASFMENNFYPADYDFNQIFSLVDCGVGSSVCQGAEGKVCLMQRDGVQTFEEKAFNCQSGGGIMAFVYNNEDGDFLGLIGSSTGLVIPALSLSQDDGLMIKNNIGRTFTLFDRGNIGSFSGTSMAAPHVAGVAAKIWASRPGCTNNQIREALRNSAKPLSNKVPSSESGYGLVQARDAYEYVITSFDPPCGEQATPTTSPMSEETNLPSESPSSAPSITLFTPRVCSNSHKDCVVNDDCCSGLYCRRVSVDPARSWACRSIAKNSKEKLSRSVNYCPGGNGGGCGKLRRGLRGKGLSREDLEQADDETVLS
jgi:subtilisin family serine protease